MGASVLTFGYRYLIVKDIHGNWLGVESILSAVRFDGDRSSDLRIIRN